MEIKTRVTQTIPIIELQGRLDAHQGPRVEKKFAEITVNNNRTVVNLSKVHFIDSTGLSVLIKWAKRQREKQGDLVLCELQQPVRIIFELTRLDRLFEIYASENEALQALQPALVG